jgi:primosomal protein N''
MDTRATTMTLDQLTANWLAEKLRADTAARERDAAITAQHAAEARAESAIATHAEIMKLGESWKARCEDVEGKLAALHKATAELRDADRANFAQHVRVGPDAQRVIDRLSCPVCNASIDADRLTWKPKS